MKDKTDTILVTGMPHSATRLVFNIISKHQHVSAPRSILNEVEEYKPLHRCFIDILDDTKLNEPITNKRNDELEYLIKNYFDECESLKYSIIKLPFYPVLKIEPFINYTPGTTHIISLRRPIDKVKLSFWARAEDLKHFRSQEMMNRQIKKLYPKERKNILKSASHSYFLERLTRNLQARMRKIENNYDIQVTNLFVEEIVSDESELIRFMESLKLDLDGRSKFLDDINEERLINPYTSFRKKVSVRLRRIATKAVNYLLN